LHDEVAALSLEDGQGWVSATLGDAPRGVVVHDGRAFVALSGDGAVVEVDLETGEELGRVEVPGAYGLVQAGDQLLVSSASDDEVVTLAEDLTPVGRRDVVAPRDLVSGAGGVYAWDARDGALWHVDGDGLLEDVTAEVGGVLLASNGERFALSTDAHQEQIVVLRPGGGSTRYRLDSPASWIGLTDEGRLLAAYEGYSGLYLVEEPDS
jgi:outer membrane protein assembly factor BamB